MACDEECTKQKAQDRLLAVINELPDLMKPSSDDIDKSIQEIQSRTYSDDPDGTPTMNENSSVNELLAATMEPPPLDPTQTFEGYQPPEIACNGKGTWAVVDSDGRLVRNTFAEERGGAPLVICTCESCGPTGSMYDSTELKWRATGSNLTGGQSVPTASHKLIYLGGPAENHNEVRLSKSWAKGGGTRYNFATGMWCDDDNTKCEDRESVAQGRIGIE